MAGPDPGAPPRKILHVDMDAFYASVAQRDQPELRGKPVVVAWRGPRSVVCAASYEARRFGVRSAMPALRAERLCPEAVFVPPDFPRYQSVSRIVRQILARYSDRIEPLSLDEAYLDVSDDKAGLGSATATAVAIRAAIHAETGLTASAGVAANKFLAKLASDWNKPDGLFVIRPRDVARLLPPLPVTVIPGVGRATALRLRTGALATLGDLVRAGPARLVALLGSYGHRLHDLAQGIDPRPVAAEQPVRSISAEDTFPEDLPLAALEGEVRRLSRRVWQARERHPELAFRTVTLKLKTAGFQVLTRATTPSRPARDGAELAELAWALHQRVPQGKQRYRLVGVALSQPVPADDPRLLDLFAANTPAREG